MRNYSGFIGRQGLSTNKIIIMNLSSISVHVSNGITYRDLVYVNDSKALWPLGGLRNLIFEIYVDDN